MERSNTLEAMKDLANWLEQPTVDVPPRHRHLAKGPPRESDPLGIDTEEPKHKRAKTTNNKFAGAPHAAPPRDWQTAPRTQGLPTINFAEELCDRMLRSLTTEYRESMLVSALAIGNNSRSFIIVI